MGRMTSLLAAVSFLCLTSPALKASAAEHIVRVGLERGVVYQFSGPVKDVTDIDSRGIVEVRTVAGDGTRLLLIGRKLGSAQLLVRVGDKDYESYVIRVLPEDSDLSEPTYSIARGNSFRIKTKDPIRSAEVGVEGVLEIRVVPADPRQLIVLGLKPGRVSLTLKTAAESHEQTTEYSVEVYEP